jgi:ATP-dependent helicase/nuclease subunit A
LEEAEWVLQYPPKPYDELDPVLAEQKQRKREDAGFQNLCALYVAMTRAKQALYVVAPRPPKKAGTVNAARLLRDTVAQIEESDQVAEVEIEWLRKFGDSAWYAAGDITLADASAKVIETSAALGALLREHQPLAKRRTPSGEEAFMLPGKVLFSAGRDAGRELGTLLHQMMEQIEWVEDDFDEASVMAVWQAKGLLDREGSTMARDMALQVIRAAACRAALAKPGPHAKVWRERSFDLVMDGGDWVSGTLDRVVIECDAQGRPLSASIIDFKTDDVADAEALAAKVHGYQPQIKLYREAVMRLTGLPADAIRARLLFTRRQQLADV